MSSHYGPVALILGAGSGIGLTVLSKLLAEKAWRVAVLTLHETPELSALESKYEKSKLITFYGDACDKNVITALVAQTICQFSYMTHVIPCLGTMLPVESIRNLSMNDFKRIYDVNVFSIVSVVQKCLPHLDKAPMKPTVIIVSSGVDIDVQYRGWSAYCTSKASLTRFIQLLAHEEKAINVYGVIPLVTQSPMVDMIFAGKYDNIMSPEEREKFNIWKKEGKIEPPEYIAESIFKAATGNITPESPEVERNVCGALFVGSMYQK